MTAVKTEQQLEQMFAELKPVEVHQSMYPLLAKFKQLSSRRSYTENGPAPLTFQEIQAFNALTQAGLDPWEVETLCSMDGVYINTWFDLSKSSQSEPA